MVIVGRPPNGYQRLLIKAADSLAPDKALASLDATARLALASVVLAATVLTGFGLFADVATRLREEPGLLAWPVAFAVGSAVFALLALLPWPGKVDVDNLNSLQSRFSSQIVVRGVLVFVSLVLLLIAIGLAAFGAARYVATSGLSTPTVSLSRQATGDTTTVAATVKASRAPAGSVAEVRIVSDGDATVYRAVQIVGSTGDVEVVAEVPEAAGGGQMTLTFRLTDDDRELLSEEATLAGD